jgi:hypothetical protein
MTHRISRNPLWLRRAESEEEFNELLPIKMWRLHNLYYINNEYGQKTLFQPRDIQLEFLLTRHGFDIILKARQLGFSTAIQIDMLDDCLFTKNQNAGVIAQSLPDAKEIFRTKIKFPYDNLPAVIRERIYPISDSKDTLELSNGSQIRVGTSLRSSTITNLHVSEFGKICVVDPVKAKEIMTGALNTVHLGQKIAVESTAEGREGPYYSMCKRAEDRHSAGTELTELDFKFHFYPWWEDPKYTLDARVPISEELRKYFEELELKHRIRLTAGQKAWYAKKEETQQEDMKREFPSTSKEAFEQAIEGAYFARQMADARRQKRIGFVPYDPSAPVNTFWDIGIGDNCSLGLHQRIGLADRFIGYYENSGEDFQHYVKYLESLDVIFGGHYLPHDSRNRTFRTKGTLLEDAQRLLKGEIYLVPRIGNKQDAIQAARNAFPRCHFDEENCGLLITRLDNYRKQWNENLGVWRNEPRHDEASHGADMFMTYATGYDPDNDSDKAESDYDDDYDSADNGRNETTGY